MKKSELISKIRICKKCKIPRATIYSFHVNEELQTETIIKCVHCNDMIVDLDPAKALARWNAKQFDKTKPYAVILQHRYRLLQVLAVTYEVESVSEISLIVEEKFPDYKILAIDEIVS